MLRFLFSPGFQGLCPVFDSILELDYRAEHGPLASPFSCPATSFWGRPVESGICGAQFLLIQSKAETERAEDQRTGISSLVLCPQALCSWNIGPAWVPCPLWCGGTGDDSIGRISWGRDWTVTLIMSLTLNKPVRSLSEQSLNGVGKESKN